jgi:sigma-B regulation protein RsbU (phosphoserine phosphatase)
MDVIELSGDPRFGRLMEFVPSLQKCRTPHEALVRFCRHLKDSYPGYAHLALSTRGLPAGQYRIWAFIDDEGTEYIEPVDPWQKLDLPILEGGTLGEITSRKIPQLASDLNWSDRAGLDGRLSPYRELIAAPLPDEQLPVNWYVRLSRQPGRLTRVDLEQCVPRVGLAAALFGSIQVSYELARAQRYINAEVERMARIQRALLPAAIPSVPGLSIDVSYKTYARVGGDFYDVFPLGGPDDPWCILIGDASGHGPSAAVVAAIIQAVLEDCARNSVGPADLLGKLNRRLCRKRIEGSFVTAFLAFYYPAARKLTYATAGHPSPLIADADGEIDQLEGPRNPPLGIDAGLSFTQASTRLHAGQQLVLYTDGVSEAADLDGNEFGVDGIRDALGPDDETASVVNRLTMALAEHRQGAKPADDQTILTIHVDGDGDLEPSCIAHAGKFGPMRFCGPWIY